RKNNYMLYLGGGAILYLLVAFFGGGSLILFVLATLIIISFYGGDSPPCPRTSRTSSASIRSGPSTVRCSPRGRRPVWPGRSSSTPSSRPGKRPESPVPRSTRPGCSSWSAPWSSG